MPRYFHAHHLVQQQLQQLFQSVPIPKCLLRQLHYLAIMFPGHRLFSSLKKVAAHAGYRMTHASGRNDMIFGMALMGGTGALIGLALHSPLVMALAGALGLAVGWFLGWLGARRYMSIVGVGAILGTAAGYFAGDSDILVISAGSGAAIAGFIAAQVELFMRRR
jgi:hypothetical protein